MNARELANAALVLEHQLQREREKRELAERTIEMLQQELLRAAEEILRLKAQQKGP